MSNSVPSAQRLHELLAQHDPQFVPALPGRTNHLEAAVMIPLFWGEQVESVAILRPETMSLHKGEVCFPGGKRDETDDTLQTTALREGREELNLKPTRVLGALSSIPLFTSDYRIQPFVCEIASKTILPNSEVARPLWFSVDELLDLEQLNAFPVRVGADEKLSPVFEVSGEVMFGATAYALLELLGIVAAEMGKKLPGLNASRYKWDWTLKRPVRNERC